MERFFILDGMAIAYRAYFAFINRPLLNSKGMNMSAVYGFTAALEKILTEEKPDHIAVAFDTKEPTFRHRAYEPYKATREKMPEDMVEQLPYLKRIVEAYNIPLLELPGWEADDIIGTLVTRAAREDLECYMVTPDKDYMQLVTDRAFIYRPGKSGDAYETVGREGVREKFGVAPEQVIDVLGLIGDASDNIPGVKGIGEKTAIPLIQEFGGIPQLYEQLDRVPKEAVRKKLEEQRDAAFLSRRLVTIDTEAPIAVDPHDLRARPKNREALRSLFTELELKRFLQRLDEEGDEAAEGETAEGEAAAAGAAPGLRNAATVPHEYVTVRSAGALARMVEELLAAPEFCFDTETTGTNPLLADLVGLSFAVRPGHAWYVPCNAELAPEAVIDALRPLFAGTQTIIGQNLKYDLTVLRMAGVTTAQPLYDTMLASYVLRPDGSHDMDSLARQFLGYEPIPITALIGKGKEQRTMAEVPVEDAAEYAAEDADVTLQLAAALRPEIARTGQERLLADIEFPLVHVLAAMESAGVRIDTAALEEISRDLRGQIEAAADRIYRSAGERFNIGSTKQLGVILFDKLGLPSGKKTKTGHSTDVSVLESLQGRHEIVDDLLLYRQLTKLASTYVDALPKMVNPRTGRVHTSYNQAVAATGRLSSVDPNLQNIPIRTEAGREIRRAFVPGEGYDLLLSVDYSQIELRLAAELSGDEGLLEAFRAGADIHASTAEKLYGVNTSDVTPEMRRRAKTTNFGILYGISAFGLAQRLGISNADAKDLIDTYFERFPRINEWIARTIAFAQAHGYVETLCGRRRYIPDIASRNRNTRMFAERTAINAPIQGSAADMIKIAMVNIHRALESSALSSRMILQVHDELVFETRREEADELTALVSDLMRTALALKVPIEVDAGSGKDWLEAH